MKKNIGNENLANDIMVQKRRAILGVLVEATLKYYKDKGFPQPVIQALQVVQGIRFPKDPNEELCNLVNVLESEQLSDIIVQNAIQMAKNIVKNKTSF